MQQGLKCGKCGEHMNSADQWRQHDCESSASPACSTPDETIERLRGQLQNCVNHIERLKRHAYRSDEAKLNACIESANKALYETLMR